MCVFFGFHYYQQLLSLQSAAKLGNFAAVILPLQAWLEAVLQYGQNCACELPAVFDVVIRVYHLSFRTLHTLPWQPPSCCPWKQLVCCATQ